jgi:pimeloyl-ACP methyl ester carboxylesterase
MVKGARRMRRSRSKRSVIAAILAVFLAVATAAVLGIAGVRPPTWSALAQDLATSDSAPVVTVPPAAAAPAPRLHVGMHRTYDEFTVHVPTNAREPLTVLVALHGVGGSAEDFGGPLYELTDRLGWAVVAPTFAYGDWRDPAQITREETRNLPRLAAFLDRLPEVVGMDVKPGALLYGFSRGGQVAQRFALVYPDRVGAVASASSGTYTLPLRAFGSEASGSALPFPYGMADCAELFGHAFDAERARQVSFWIGVGSRDSDPVDVPQQWTPYIGDDRLEGAGRFAQALRSAGISAEVAEFAETGHNETGEVRTAAIRFLSAAR